MVERCGRWQVGHAREAAFARHQHGQAVDTRSTQERDRQARLIFGVANAETNHVARRACSHRCEVDEDGGVFDLILHVALDLPHFVGLSAFEILRESGDFGGRAFVVGHAEHHLAIPGSDVVDRAEAVGARAQHGMHLRRQRLGCCTCTLGKHRRRAFKNPRRSRARRHLFGERHRLGEQLQRRWNPRRPRRDDPAVARDAQVHVEVLLHIKDNLGVLDQLEAGAVVQAGRGGPRLETVDVDHR